MLNVMHESNTYKADDLVGKISMPTIVTKQGNRVVYQLNLMFRQITNLLDHMPIKSAKEKNEYQDTDLIALRNRFVKAEKAQEIVQYVSENRDSYILPPISAVTEHLFPFLPYNHLEVKERLGEEYDLVQRPELIGEVLDEFDGILQGMVIMKESDFQIGIMDGNHRTASIHQLTTLGKEYKNMRIGLQIFHESDEDRQKQAFVDLNTSTPIDKTLLTLFGNRDPLSVAAKESIGENPLYVIDEFNIDSNQYIGFDMINDSVSKSGNAVLTLNMVKNMLVRFALGESGTKKKFDKMYPPGSSGYDRLLREFKEYLQLIFQKVEPFMKIKQAGVHIVPTLRESSVSLSGAGLYILANMGYLARESTLGYEEVATRLGQLEWKREVLTPNGKEYNPLFRSGILNESGNISNNRSAHVSTLRAVMNAIGMSED